MKGSTPQKEEKKAKAKPEAKKAEAVSAVRKEEKAAAKTGSVILSKHAHACRKSHPFQDAKYGGRVANITKGGKERRCTVCGESV